MREAVLAWRVRAGRRGMVLAVLGGLWITMGVLTWTLPPGPAPLLNLWSELHAAAWAATGLVAILTAHRTNDSAGWVALYLMAGERVLGYVAAWADALITTRGGPGDPQGAITGMPWVIVLVLITACSAWLRECPGGEQ